MFKKKPRYILNKLKWRKELEWRLSWWWRNFSLPPSQNKNGGPRSPVLAIQLSDGCCLTRTQTHSHACIFDSALLNENLPFTAGVILFVTVLSGSRAGLPHTLGWTVVYVSSVIEEGVREICLDAFTEIKLSLHLKLV